MCAAACDTHRGGSDPELALPVHQAVLYDGEEAGVCVSGADPYDDGAQRDVLVQGFL